MALRSPKVRDAYETVRKDKAEQRKARKAEAIKHVQAWKASTLPGAKDKRDLDKPFLAFVRRQPCAAARLGGCEGPIEAAHVRYSSAKDGVRNPGLQAKNHDRHANPLCRHHHQSDQHKRREQAFWSDVGLDAYANAARLYAQFLAGSSGSQRVARNASTTERQQEPRDEHPSSPSPSKSKRDLSHG